MLCTAIEGYTTEINTIARLRKLLIITRIVKYSGISAMQLTCDLGFKDQISGWLGGSLGQAGSGQLQVPVTAEERTLLVHIYHILNTV